MAKASPISAEEWKFAIKIKSNQDYFNFLSRNYIAKESLHAIKVHAIEFIVKP